MTTSRAFRASVLAASCLVLVAVGGCSWIRQVVGLGPAWQRISECPHYYSIYLKGRNDSLLALPDVQRDVPEYNDCQRLAFPDKGQRKYGPLATIFASKRLAQLVQDQQDSTAAAGGQLRAIAAASVLVPSGNYRRLGLETGENCVYLWRGVGGWDARVVRRSDVGACTAAFDPLRTVGKDLNVTEVTGAVPPSVARWGRDQQGWHTIGVRCGSAWCLIGSGNFNPAATPVVDLDVNLDAWLASVPGQGAQPATAAQLRAMIRAGGWHDEQLLAPSAGSDAPSSLWGAVIPHPQLDTMTHGGFVNQWRVTAFVYIAPPDAEGSSVLSTYNTKFNFDAGWNVMALCTGTACPGVTTTCAGGWYAAVHPRSAAGGASPAIMCVHRIPQSVGHVVGAARWRWIRSDETVWMRCVDGCCEVEERP